MVNIENLKNHKISYIFEKAFVISIVYAKCGSGDEKIFKEEEWIEKLKILGLIKNIWLLKKYGEENSNLDFRF